MLSLYKSNDKEITMNKYIAMAIRIISLGAFVFLMIIGKPMLWLIIFGVSLILSIFFGRFYCGYLCPINTIMIPVDWVARKTKIQSDKSPKFLKNGYLSWVALIVSIVLMIVFNKVLKISLPILIIWGVIAIPITLFFKPEVFHNLICPFGALQRLFGRLSIFSKKVEKDSCIGCGLCERVCPSNAINVVNETKKAEIDKSLCHQCTECKDVCPKNAIKYSNTLKNNHKEISE